MNPVSIVIPVHNEDYVLPRCLDSVLAQTYRELEIIIVDDGSRDESAAICEQYVARDDRIRVIRQEQSGVSAARNRGLDAASGTYVQFVDADDCVEPAMTETLVELIETGRADLACSGFYRVDVGPSGSTTAVMSLPEEGAATRGEYLAMVRFTRNYRLFAPIWNKLYRLSTIKSHALRFRPGMAIAEDYLFNIHYAAHCEKVALTAAPLYRYIAESAPDHLPMGERFEPDSIATMLLLCRELMNAGAGAIPEGMVSRMKGSFASQLLVAIVKACRRDSPLPQRETLEQLRRLRREPDAMEWLAHYRPGPGQSQIMPFLLRHNLLRPLFYLARSKADRRYPFSVRNIAAQEA